MAGSEKREMCFMAKRTIITIDRETCNGCGECVTSCAEGALQIVNGKAELVREQFCDGLGACLGECPTGALKLEQRESEEFDEESVKKHLEELRGGVDIPHRSEGDRARPDVGGHPLPLIEASSQGCPGTRMRFSPKGEQGRPSASASGAGHMMQSELEQWPVQIHLVQPGAAFFSNRELAVLSTCSPIASADVHWRFIRGRGVVVGCPKLDQTDSYVEKLAAILADRTIPAVVVVRMEVPCCGGLSQIAREAVALSGRTDLEALEATVGLNGDLLETRELK